MFVLPVTWCFLVKGFLFSALISTVYMHLHTYITRTNRCVHLYKERNIFMCDILQVDPHS